MKKRILALALAGTTAFSVFGAAVSANAAVVSTNVTSAQYVTSNDQYKHYTPVAKNIVSSKAESNVTKKYYIDSKTGANNIVDTKAATNEVLLADYLKKVDVQANYTTATKYTKENANTVTIFGDDSNAAKATAFGFTIVPDSSAPNADKYVYDGKQYDTVDAAVSAAGYTKVDAGYVTKGTHTGAIDATTYTNLPADASAYQTANLTEYKTTNEDASTYTTLVDGTNGWDVDSTLSADATVYPWKVSTKYVQDGAGATIALTQAELNKTVYLLDFIPANSLTVSASTVANEIKNGSKTIYDANAAHTWTAEKGYGTVYGVRAEVVSKYEDFLNNLVLLGRYGDYYYGKEANGEQIFKSQYSDMYAKGYIYNTYTGIATGAKWSVDLYNIDELLGDIYDSSVITNGTPAYYNMNTSEMMYLMQQYNKYIGNYITPDEVSKDEWGDLLVSILQSVDADDFSRTVDYKNFTRKAEDAIDAYDNATTSSLIKAAERQMYTLITGSYTRATSAKDAKAELNTTLYSTYFNIGNVVTSTKNYGYDVRGAVVLPSNASLKDYAYVGAVTSNFATVWDNSTQVKNQSYTGAGYYSLYPAADYVGANTDGNKEGNVNSKSKYVSDEYNWFLNVYELANNVNSNSNVSGVVSAANDALTKAIDALSVTKTAAASASTKLDEAEAAAEKALDFYVTGNGVNEGDFNATYYKAYTKALEIADAAEGAEQVANATAMVKVAADALGYNGAQITVTKNDIKSLETAIKNGQAAVKSIKDSANYNAAQVTALNNAIAQAQDIVAIFNGTNGAKYNKVNTKDANFIGDKDCIVKSDITGAVSAIDSAINYSNVVMGWSKNDAGKWQYGTKDGYLSNGWNKVGKTWFYFNADGTAKQSEWLQENGKWYYFNSNCGALCGWGKVDGNWYYFKGDNHMKTGWEKVDGNWYYLASSGKMVTGWTQIDGKWYYFSKESNSLGQMLANTTVDGYKLDANGVWNK